MQSDFDGFLYQSVKCSLHSWQQWSPHQSQFCDLFLCNVPRHQISPVGLVVCDVHVLCNWLLWCALSVLHTSCHTHTGCYGTPCLSYIHLATLTLAVMVRPVCPTYTLPHSHWLLWCALSVLHTPCHTHTGRGRYPAHYTLNCLSPKLTGCCFVYRPVYRLIIVFC
jgi:hypothetical protein